MVTSDQISIFFDIYRHKSPLLTQYHLILTQYYKVPTSTAPYWHSTTKYQPVPASTDPVPPSTIQYQTQYHHIQPISPYTDHASTSTALQWQSVTINQWQHYGRRTFQTILFANSTVRLSFVNLRWAQLYVSLVYFVHVLLQLFILELQAYAEKVGHSEY